jgi:drug/metabolite transporter (DMT)-like permease
MLSPSGAPTPTPPPRVRAAFAAALRARASGAFARLGPEAQGVVLMIAAVFAFSIMDMTAKGLVEREPSMMVVWARYASQTFWALILFAPRLRVLLRTKRLGLHALRTVFMFSATSCFFLSLRYMQLAEALAVFEIAPLVITGLAFAVLREPVGPRRLFGVCLGFVGALIIIRPGTDVFSPASLLPLGAAFSYASYSIATRFLGDQEHPLTSFLWTSIMGSALASLMLPFVWHTPSAADATVMALFGIIGGVGQYCMILALSVASASVLAPIGYIGLPIGAFWGLVVFGEVPDAWTVAGALVIVGSGLYVWWRERRRAA